MSAREAETALGVEQELEITGEAGGEATCRILRGEYHRIEPGEQYIGKAQ